MVEMRWLERYVDDVLYSNVIGAPGAPVKRLERVLQYREGTTVNHDYYGRIESWSDWQDVPAVRHD